MTFQIMYQYYFLQTIIWIKEIITSKFLYSDFQYLLIFYLSTNWNVENKNTRSFSMAGFLKRDKIEV